MEQPTPHVRAAPPLSVEQEGMQVFISLKQDRANWIQAVATVIASAIAFASIWLVTAQWRDQRRARGLELMERFQAQFDSMDMLATRAEAAANVANPSASPAVLEVFNFFERVGRHRRDGLITLDQVDYFFRDPVLCYWFAYEDWAKAVRRAGGEDPESGEQFREFQLLVRGLQTSGHKRPPDAQIRFILSLEQKRYEKTRASKTTMTSPVTQASPPPENSATATGSP